MSVMEEEKSGVKIREGIRRKFVEAILAPLEFGEKCCKTTKKQAFRLAFGLSDTT